MITIKCKYCGGLMDARTNRSSHKRYYECRECGARGPWMDSDSGTDERLALLTIGRTDGIAKISDEDDLRLRNSLLSARCSRLKSSELPTVNRRLRETDRQMMDLQDVREDHDKADYFDEMSGLYHKKAVYLRYKADYENEFRDLRRRILENRARLKELRDGSGDGKEKREGVG